MSFKAPKQDSSEHERQARKVQKRLPMFGMVDSLQGFSVNSKGERVRVGEGDRERERGMDGETETETETERDKERGVDSVHG